MPTLESAWTPALSGGLPELETWHANPQFAIYPSENVEGASYTIEMVRHDAASQVRAGLWVMKADAMEARKTEFTGLLQKTKVSTTERRSLTLDLPPRKGGLPYIASCATQEAGVLGGFTLTVTSVEDEGVRVVPLQEAPGAAPAAAPKQMQPAAAATAAAAPPKAPRPLGDFTNAGPPKLKKAETSFAFGSTPPDNEFQLETLGQGLSKKLEKESQEKVAAASAAAQAGGGLYEDGEFAPGAAALGADEGAVGVASWRRVHEIEPPTGKHDGLLDRAEGNALALGALNDEWLVGALNVVGGNADVLRRTFVDLSHVDLGFVVVRLWAEDPNSDDDWAVVLIDDRIPCGADGAPAFCRGRAPGALWASLVEKAVAKRYGSYAALDGDGGGEATLRGLELITGGKVRPAARAPPRARRHAPRARRHAPPPSCL